MRPEPDLIRTFVGNATFSQALINQSHTRHALATESTGPEYISLLERYGAIKPGPDHNYLGD